jgi:isopenicillin-N epimerase
MAANPFREHWTLDPAVTFLNHGSYGACPRVVLEAQQRLRAELEAEPVHYMSQVLEPALDEARAEAARFVGADAEGFAFVPNATTGVNTVLASLAADDHVRAGDELLTTDHAYNACRNALDLLAQRTGARVVVARVPFPLTDAGQVVDAVLGATTAKTRLALLDHVTSPTGLVFPVERLVPGLQDRGVDVLIDAAHAPGMVDLDVTALGAAYTTGNFHKWVCAPKGAAFLHVRADRRDRIRPLVTSHGANDARPERSRFRKEFDWTGTDDPSAWLCVPEAIRFLGGLFPGGWPELRRRNREGALAARRRLAARWKLPLPAPDDMIGSLATLPLPDAPDGEDRPRAPSRYKEPLQAALVEQHRIQIPVMAWPARPKRLIRTSTQVYNTPEDVERLLAALEIELEREQMEVQRKRVEEEWRRRLRGDGEGPGRAAVRR